MICKNCGENLPDNARECFTCFVKVSKNEITQPIEQNEVPFEIKKKEKLTVENFLIQMFSFKEYKVLTILLSVLSLLSIFAFAWVLLSKTDVMFGWGDILTLLSRVLLTVLAWGFLIRSKKIGENIGREFKILLPLVRYYVFVQLGLVVIGTAINVFSMDAEGTLTIGLVWDEALSLVLGILPLYAAFLLVRSVEEAVICRFLKLEGIKMFLIIAVLSMVAYAMMILPYVIAAFLKPISLILAIRYVLDFFIWFLTYHWLNKISRM